MLAFPRWKKTPTGMDSSFVRNGHFPFSANCFHILAILAHIDRNTLHCPLKPGILLASSMPG
jgi:hypothetical protein